VLTHKNCGFVNFVNMETAVAARNDLNGKEIFPGAPVRIGFAKEPSASVTPAHNGLYPSPSPDPHAKGHGETLNASASNSKTNNIRPENANAPPKTPELPDMREDIIRIVKDLGASEEEQARIAAQVEQAILKNNYVDEIPPVDEPSPNRVHDAPKLREIRKRIDNNTVSAAEIEDIAMKMLPEIAELSSDYLGNTVVQKLFEYCSEATQVAMLQEIAPHLATIGTHKNGTWAAQKIIDVARKSTTLQAMVVQALTPYAVALFQDQFGNYVIQGCLRYESPTNNFIFEAMLGRLWDLAQGRFSARAMRACLESHNATKDQQRMIAAAIALHSVQLATNANGALLLTWFLDTCTFLNKRTVLAPRLVPHLVHLGTHKVAYLTVLKLVNQRNEPEARDTILRALFFSPNDQVLEDILMDPQCGATFIWKVLTTPFFDDSIRAEVTENIRKVLIRIKAQSVQGYKRLMDEVNLPTQRGGGGHRDHSATRTGPSRDSPGPVHVDPSGRVMPVAATGGFDPVVLQRTASTDSNGFEQYPVGPGGAMYMPTMPMPANSQPMQYFGARNGPYYSPVNGFPAAGPAMDSFRNVSPVAAPGFTGAPMLQPTGVGQQMGSAMAGQVPYGYGPYVSPQQQVPSGSQRRGRVSVSFQNVWLDTNSQQR
jgi:protein JSN1